MHRQEANNVLVVVVLVFRLVGALRAANWRLWKIEVRGLLDVCVCVCALRLDLVPTHLTSFPHLVIHEFHIFSLLSRTQSSESTLNDTKDVDYYTIINKALTKIYRVRVFAHAMTYVVFEKQQQHTHIR